MELLMKIRTLFRRKPEIVPPAPLYADEEFLEFIAAQARNRTRQEPAQASKSNPPTAPLGNAA
jgi:hypothetical protein